ncbi:MAG TPA: hypothetical protein EYP04_12285 [Anaerolineae bacterium]|nr:hypothetical protein [Anaerolineae bacterium]HIQ04616.1 hypothetical protein [Anaerolineae bacterium]
MSIVNNDDSRNLLDRLAQRGFGATLISTTGGFLREGNATIFVGVDDEKVDEVLSIIRQSCRTRSRYVNPLPPVMESGELHIATPLEVQVGGATVFVMNVERFEKC